MFALLASHSLTAQFPSSNDGFPQFNPILGEEDVLSNARPYYAYTGPYTFCTLSPSGVPNCARNTFQYVFEAGREAGDGNSEVDLYYTDQPGLIGTGAKPLIILLHGGSGDRKSTAMVRRALDLARRGFVAAVPDYLTARDDVYGTGSGALDLSCLADDQKLLMLQQSLRDVYSVARASLKMSADGALGATVIDPDALFLFGVSHGGYTSLHFAALTANYFPVGEEVTFENGNVLAFASELHTQAICPEPDGCVDFEPYPGYNTRASLQGVACSAPFTIDPALFQNAALPPILLFHGTCDASAPYWEVDQGDAIARAAVSSFPDFDISILPCQLPDDPEGMIYGSQVIFEALNAADPQADHLRGLVTFCGGRHDIGSVYGPLGDNPNNIQIGIMEYEYTRFFSGILNDIHQENFHYILDDYQRTTNSNDAISRDNHCNAVQNIGGQWPGIATVCPNCLTDATAYFNQVRLPYFQIGNDDENRYPRMGQYAELFSACEDVLQTNNPEYLNAYKLLLQVVDLLGNRMMPADESGKYTLSDWMNTRSTRIAPGMYIAIYEDGARKAMVITQ